MDPLPDVVPISELRTRQNELLEQASEKPILLTQHGKEVAVLLGPEPYNRLLEQLDDLRLAFDAVEARAEVAPPTEFGDYLEERGRHVPTTPDE